MMDSRGAPGGHAVVVESRAPAGPISPIAPDRTAGPERMSPGGALAGRTTHGPATRCASADETCATSDRAGGFAEAGGGADERYHRCQEETMFGMQTSRRHKAERVAGQAWNNLVSAVDNAGTATRSATRRAATMVDGASDRVGSGTAEARRRANAAMDALAGRPPRKPWGWLAAATLVGAAVGWAAQRVGRQIVGRPEPLPLPDSLADHSRREESIGEGALIVDTPSTRPV